MQQIKFQNPIAHDQDRFVQPDKTRTDDEIARDEQIATRLHMSGEDGSDEFWAEHDELYGEDASDDDEFGRMIMRKIAQRRREHGYEPELDGEEEDEDPLEGDVDRWVDPNETR